MDADKKDSLPYETNATAREGNTGSLDRLDRWLTGVGIVIITVMLGLIILALSR